MTSNTQRGRVRTMAQRRKEFRAALALAELTQTAWAASHEITPEHVSLVLSGKRESKRLIEKVDAFIAEHLTTRAA